MGLIRFGEVKSKNIGNLPTDYERIERILHSSIPILPFPTFILYIFHSINLTKP